MIAPPRAPGQAAARAALAASACALMLGVVGAACTETRAGTADAEHAPGAAPGAAPPAPATAAADTAAVRCDGEGLARTCTVAGLFADAPDVRLALTTGDAVPDTLLVALVRPGAAPRRLPTFYGSRVWGTCGPTTDARDLPRRDRLAVADVDGDGAADVIVVGECMTGIGATGAVPFPAGAVYLGDGRGGYRSVERVDSALTELAQAACGDAVGRPGTDPGGVAPCDVRALAREALRRAGS